MTIKVLLKKIPPLSTMGCLSIFLCAAVYFSAGPSPNETISGQWVRITPSAVNNYITLAGKIEPHTTLAISAPFDGEIHEYLVKPGQKVEPGQPLVMMNPSLLETKLRDSLGAMLKAERTAREVRNWHSSNQVIKVRRALRAAQMRLRKLQSKLLEAQALFDRGIIARIELDEVHQQVEFQHMEVSSAQEEIEQVLALGDSEMLKIAEMELTNAKVKHQALNTLLKQRIVIAPFAGVIVSADFPQTAHPEDSTPVQSGSKVNQGKILFGLANVEQLKIISEVSELDINKLQPGQPVEILGDGFSGSLSGKLESVSNHATPNKNSELGAKFLISITLNKSTQEQLQEVRLGMSTKISIITHHNTNSIIVPLTAINKSASPPTLMYRASLTDESQKIQISTGHVSPLGIEVFGIKEGFVHVPQ